MCVTVGCGRYAPPLTPELLAPRPVGDLLIKPLSDGINFSWSSPRSDARGKELKTMSGYRVYRKLIKEQSDIVNTKKQFEILAEVPDTHVAERERLRKEARASGKPGRRIEAPSELKKFQFVDNAVTTDTSYLYKIIPYNQDNVEGLGEQMILVRFSGESSEVSRIDSDTADFGEDSLE